MIEFDEIDENVDTEELHFIDMCRQGFSLVPVESEPIERATWTPREPDPIYRKVEREHPIGNRLLGVSYIGRECWHGGYWEQRDRTKAELVWSCKVCIPNH